MEVDEIQVRKFQRIGTNGRSTTAHHNKIVPPPPHKAEDHHHAADQYHHHQNHHPEDEEDGLSVSLVKQRSNGGGGGTGLDIIGAGARFGGWPSSRIIRVSRASGGKDRHSKVLTSKGLRDRRVRLSVTTAIQFYDLQDRLGYDQPSKAVEWLLQAAKSSISELPSLNPSFPDTPKSEENNNKRASENSEHGFDDSAPEHVELDGGDPHDNYVQQQQQQGFSNSKSACSSTSETSKGSGGLSLSRSESRIRARERARERAAEKEKEKDNESQHGTDHQNVSPISQNNNSSFTELLTAGISSNNNNSNNSPNGGGGGDDSNLANKSRGQWSTTSPIPMEYLSAGLFGPRGGQTSSGFPGHTQLGINNTIPQFGDHHHQNHLQHFSFVPENFSIPVATSAGAGGSSECAYNLNFSISSTTSGLAGYNRGTLQSNSSQSSSLLHPHYNIQRFPSIDGSNLPFFIGTSSAAAADNQHHPHFPAAAGFDARLQLCYGDSPTATARHSDHHKGKGK